MKSTHKNHSYQKEEVLVSSDYERFVPHGHQRIIQPGQVKKLMTSMKQYGFMPSSPIACFRDGANFRIIDGHHRHAAASTLKIPLYFMLLSADMECAVGDTNIGKPWTNVEWARKYALEGRPHYLTLNKYVVSGIPLSLAASLLYGHEAGTGNVNRLLQTGDFVVKETARIDKILALINDIADICPAAKTRSFIEALSRALGVKGFDISRLQTKIEARPKELIKTATSQQMLELLEKIYNYNAQDKIPLAFMAREAASNRSAAKKKS